MAEGFDSIDLETSGGSRRRRKKKGGECTQTERMAKREIFWALIAVIKSKNLPDSPVEISNRRAPSNYSQSPGGARFSCNPFSGRRAFNSNFHADFPRCFQRFFNDPRCQGAQGGLRPPCKPPGCSSFLTKNFESGKSRCFGILINNV